MVHLSSRIHEVIITSISEDGRVHAAPMGISEVNGHFQIKPFKPSTTYENLRLNRVCAINFTDDVRVFAGAMTGHRDWPTRACEKIPARYLEAALFHIECEIVELQDDSPRATFEAIKVHEQMHAPFLGFNRAQSAVIEAAILVSRLDMLPAGKIQEDIQYLKIAIEKTAGARELEAWEWLIDKIQQAGIILRHD